MITWKVLFSGGELIPLAGGIKIWKSRSQVEICILIKGICSGGGKWANKFSASGRNPFLSFPVGKTLRIAQATVASLLNSTNRIRFEKQEILCEGKCKNLKQLDDEIPLQLLSKTLVILLFILPGQRDQTLKALNIEHVALEEPKCTFFIKALLKTARRKFLSTANRI